MYYYYEQAAKMAAYYRHKRRMECIKAAAVALLWLACLVLFVINF